MERDDIKKVLSELSKNYATFQLSDTSTAWWNEALKPFDAVKVFEVIKHWVFNEKWPPSIAEIRERCQPPLPAELKIDGLAAFNQRRTNKLAAEVFEDLEAAYGPYGQWTLEENPWRIKEFANRYEERRDILREHFRQTGQILLTTNKINEPSCIEAKNFLANVGLLLAGPINK